MSFLRNLRPRPAQYSENGHANALRIGKSFIFDAAIPTIAPAGIVVVRFTTGDSAIVFEGGEIVITQEAVTLEVFEDSTFTAPGSADATLIRHMNRMKPLTPEIVVYTAPTVDDIGTIVAHQLAVGQAGQNVNQPGFGGSIQDSSFVLKPNTEHVLRITNNSVLGTTVEAHYFFREVDPRQYR